MDGEIDEADNITITTIYDIGYSSPSNSTIVLASFGGLFLIGGILQTVSGTIWLLISWVKRRRKEK
jgi:hypothetical protein